MTPSERIPYILSYILSLVLLFAALTGFYHGQWFNAFLASLGFALTYLPALLARNFKVVLPLELEMLMVFFVFAAIYLGDLQGYYLSFWWWDLFLHTCSGFILGLVGFVIIYILNSQERIRLSLTPLFVGFFAFIFSIALGTIWEIFEFLIDLTLDLGMQGLGVNDTMEDMIVNLLGAFVTAFLGALYVKNGQTHLINGLLTKLVKKNPQLFKKIRRKS